MQVTNISISKVVTSGAQSITYTATANVNVQGTDELKEAFTELRKQVDESTIRTSFEKFDHPNDEDGH